MNAPTPDAQPTTTSIFRTVTWLLGLILFVAVMVVVCRQYVFVEQQETPRFDDLVAQLKRSGMNVGELQTLVDPAGAQAAAKVRVEQTPVELYHFDVDNRQQLALLRKIRDSGKLERGGKEVPALVNGAFVMTGSEDNPSREALEREFLGFGDFEGIREEQKMHE